MAEIPADQRMRAAAAMPGVVPCATPDWITVDAAYADQLAQKAALLAQRRADVLQVRPEGEAAASELLDHVLGLLDARSDFKVSDHAITRPDGVRVTRDEPPFKMLSQLLQEDLCILQKQGDVHVLTAALLCFPAGWTLAEKLGRPLMAIHTPVPSYTDEIGKRVQRLFDGVQAGRPIWRANLLDYDDPDLFQPHKEASPRPKQSDIPPYERSERQTLIRLPKTQSVVFAIHTKVFRRNANMDTLT